MKRIDLRKQKGERRATAKKRVLSKTSPGLVFSFKKESLFKIGVVVLLIGFSWAGLSRVAGTIAFYLDSETSAGNLFDAALLDFELASPADFTPEVSIAEDAERQISVTDIQSIAFHYRVRGENFVGPLCGVLNFQAFLKSDQKYSGPLVDFQAGDFGFAQPEGWEYIASLTTNNPDFHGTTCQFDLVHSGWQIQFPILFSGFHDIETIPSLIAAKAPQCNALSQGYWRNHEGCSNGGQGTSDWTVEINGLSSSYSGAFSSITGEQICESLWTPNCSGGKTVEAKLCKAEAHTLANELNVVSGRQDTTALLAGADDGFPAFNNLGLSPSSTVEEALDAIEAILANPFASLQQLGDANHVAERIYAFYEEENLLAPLCVFDLNDLPSIESTGEAGGGTVPPQEKSVESKVHGNVVLNEIMPNPEGDDSQPGLDGEWVELYNLEDYPVDLAGWYLELASGQAPRLDITSDNTHIGSTTIGENGSGSEWLVVFVENTILNNIGDTVSLFDLSDKLKDSHTYSAFADDSDQDSNESGGDPNEGATGSETPGNEGKSTARIPDGTGEWIDPIPTPGGPNKLAEGEELPQEEPPPSAEGSSTGTDPVDTDATGNLVTEESAAIEDGSIETASSTPFVEDLSTTTASSTVPVEESTHTASSTTPIIEEETPPEDNTSQDESQTPNEEVPNEGPVGEPASTESFGEATEATVPEEETTITEEVIVEEAPAEEPTEGTSTQDSPPIDEEVVI